MKIKNYLLIILLFASSVAFPQAATTVSGSIQAPNPAGTTITRTYRLYIPSNYNPANPLPLLFNFHGTGSTSAQQQAMCGFNSIADTAKFFVVYPQAETQTAGAQQGSVAWTVTGTVAAAQASDVKFVSMLLDTLKANYSIDACRVYATGFSSGGMMTYEVGCYLNSLFAAIAPVSGLMLTQHYNGRTLTHPTPVFHTHGDADPTVSYTGGTGMESADNLVSNFATYNACAAPTTTTLANNCTTDGCTVESSIYPNGTNGSSVQKYKIIGGKHTWPTATCGSTSGTNGDYGGAALAIWKFLRPYCIDNLNGTPPACAQPSVTTQPNSTTICAGGNASFGIAATGDGLTYQWQVDNGTGFTNVTNAPPYSTTTTATLTITGATAGLDGYKYKCVVSGTCTPATPATSNQAVLIIPAAPTATITGDATICSGTTAIISVAFTGTGPWTVTKAVNGTNQAPVSPPTSPYTFSASSAGVITIAAVSDNTGCSGTSSGSATVKVVSAKTTSNKIETCNGGNTDYTVEFDVAGGDTTTYAVTGGTGTFSTPTHFISDPIPSGTSYSLTVTDAYSCGTSPVISGTKTCGSGCSAATAVISGDATICSGTSATISVALTGDSPWSVTIALDGTDQTPVTVNASPYTFTTTTTGVYTVSSIIGNNNCNETISGSATIAENTSITTSTPIETCSSGNYVVEFDISGGNGNYTVTGGTMTTATHFTSNPIASGTSYSITVSDSYNCNPIAVTGTKTCSGTPPSNCTGSISGGGTVCPATSTTTNITISATGTGPWTVVYAIDGIDQPAATLPTSPQVVPASAAGVYTLTSVTDNTGCVASVSGSVTVTQNCPAPGCTATAAISGNTTICSGTSATISIALAGTGPWSFAYSINGGSPITATSTSSTYTFAATTAGTYALTGVTDATPCSGTTSGSATVVVNSAITASSAIASCSVNNSTYTVEFDISGGNPASYTVSGGTITNGNHFTSNPINSGSPYSFSINDANNCTPVTVTGTKTCVNTGPCNATATMSGGGTICNGSTSTLTVALTGQAPWNFTIDPGNITITNQNTSPFTITTTVAGTFSVTAIADATCTGTSSGSAVVTSCYVGPPPTGIEENSYLKDIIIYPNPTSGNIHISIKNATFSELQITVVDVLGTAIYTELEKGISADYLKQINLEHVPSGMYYIKLSNGNDNVIRKLIVQ